MIISDERSRTTMPYYNIQPGMVFEFEGEFFMRMDNSFCVSLSNGEYLGEEQDFSYECEVTPVHAELIISEWH